MKKSIFMISLAVLSVGMVGCAQVPQKYRLVRNNSNDYLIAQTTQPLQVPAGYSSDLFQEHYVVPNPQLANHGKPPSLTPPNVSHDQSLI